MKSLMDTQNRRVMTNEEAELMLRIMMTPEMNDQFDEEMSVQLGFVGQVLYKRLVVCSTVKVTKGVALLVAQLSEGNPGNIVMWTYTLHSMMKDGIKHMITMNDFVNVFPHGVPTEAGYHEIWDAQKNGGANMLDDKSNW